MVCGLCDKAKITELLSKLPDKYGNYRVDGHWSLDSNANIHCQIAYFEMSCKYGVWCAAYVDDYRKTLTFADGTQAMAIAETPEVALQHLLDIINEYSIDVIETYDSKEIKRERTVNLLSDKMLETLINNGYMSADDTMLNEALTKTIDRLKTYRDGGIY